MPVIVGSDGYRYEVAEGWAKLPPGMEFNADAQRPTPTEGFGLAWPGRDDDVADVIATVLARVPANLCSNGGRSTRLSALQQWEASNRVAISRELLVAAALVHQDADERRIAEYLLRHRGDLTTGRRDKFGLVRAARASAEMDVRRVVFRERPTASEALIAQPIVRAEHRADDPSVADLVVGFLENVVSASHIEQLAESRIRDGVVSVLELAERHHLNGGSGPSLIAMRPDARPSARLVTHLQPAFGDKRVARSVSRLLVGSDGTSIETAVLWWVAQSRRELGTPRPIIVRRWARDLRTAGESTAVAA